MDSETSIAASSALAFLCLLGPASLAGVAIASRLSIGRKALRRLSQAAAALNLLTAALSAAAVASFGPVQSLSLGTRHVGLSVRLDGLSVTMFALVAFVGLIVVRYSLTYLDREPRQAHFLGGLLLTLSAVSLLVLSGSLLQLVIGWGATSAALHRMLLFHRDRPAAVIAARKKFFVARLGDLCLLVACFLLVEAFATTDIGLLLARARDAKASSGASGGTTVAAVLLACAALLKSAQFPTHGWLLEVMETPTPVSALLHAGVINAGGFLVLRLSDVFVLGAVSLDILAVVGAFTALFGALAMLCQPSVKISLAYSTIAQMGFMLLQCGLGAFAAALVHIVAHSLYKAHAFLSSGSAVTAMRPLGPPGPLPTVSRILAATAIVTVLLAGVGAVLGTATPQGASVVLVAILALGLSSYVVASTRASRSKTLQAQALVVTAALCAMYFLFHAASAHVLEGLVAYAPTSSVARAAAIIAAVAFAAVVFAQARFNPEPGRHPAWLAVYVTTKNGLYTNVLMNRLAGAWRRPTQHHHSQGSLTESSP
jgi:NAD(P)H-quinone oxidoreductase subunit 5